MQHKYLFVTYFPQLQKKFHPLWLSVICCLIWSLMGAPSSALVSEDSSLPSKISDWELFLDDEKLSARINGVPLKTVLMQLQSISQISIVVDEEIAAELIEVNFQDIPFEQGIGLLLQGHRFIMTMNDPGTSRGHLHHTIQSLYVYAPLPLPKLRGERSDGQPGSIRLSSKIDQRLFNQQDRVGTEPRGFGGPNDHPHPLEDYGDLSEEDLIQLASEKKDPSLRLAALEELLDRGQISMTIPFLKQEMQSPDHFIREQTLELIASLSPPPIDLLSEVILQDSHEDLRLAALEHLANEVVLEEKPNPTALGALRHLAQNAPHVDVRIEALENIMTITETAPLSSSHFSQIDELLKVSQADPHPSVRLVANDLMEDLQELNLSKPIQ